MILFSGDDRMLSDWGLIDYSKYGSGDFDHLAGFLCTRTDEYMQGYARMVFKNTRGAGDFLKLNEQSAFNDDVR